MENDKLLIKNDAGEVKEYSILSVFKIDNRDEDYAIFTDYSINENQEMNIYSGILLPSGLIQHIENEEDFEIINAYIEKLLA